jgi:hypothetical protein
MPHGASPALARLGKLSDGSMRKLLESLAKPLIRSGDIVRAIGGSVEEWSESDADEFVGHIISLSALATSHDYEPKQLAEIVRESVAEESSERLSNSFVERLAAVLSSQGLMGFAKAVDVSREFERLFHRSRVITDIRPVFESDARRKPLGAVIVHTLRIDYFSQGRVHTTSLAMEPDDLKQLIKTLERAETKADTLGKTLEKADLVAYDTDMNEESDE